MFQRSSHFVINSLILNIFDLLIPTNIFIILSFNFNKRPTVLKLVIIRHTNGSKETNAAYFLGNPLAPDSDSP